MVDTVSVYCYIMLFMATKARNITCGPTSYLVVHPILIPKRLCTKDMSWKGRVILVLYLSGITKTIDLVAKWNKHQVCKNAWVDLFKGSMSARIVSPYFCIYIYICFPERSSFCNQLKYDSCFSIQRLDSESRKVCVSLYGILGMFFQTVAHARWFFRHFLTFPK